MKSDNNGKPRVSRGPVPFWFVNADMSREDVAAEFDAMRSKGIEEVLVHARYGITVDYLSEEWFELFGWCIQEAKTREMRLWVYDELNWPSGTAGMTVQIQDPSYMSKYLSVVAKPKGDIDLLFFEPGQFLIAGHLQAGRITKTRELPDLHALRALNEDWHVFNCLIKRDPYYIDTLSKAAVDTFKRRTHEEYRHRFGEEFGKTIRAVFTDEPSIYWVSVGNDDWNIPYTERLFKTFEEKYHYSAVPNIPYLFFPGHNSASFRVDFWEHVANLFNTNYHGNLGAWCRRHKLLYTGHNNCEEPLRYQIRFQGDMFGSMKQMDIPGVDHLEKDTLGNRWISVIGHKIASSQAHASGKPRVMSESFGLMDWDATYLDMKKVVDWQFAHGVNLLVPHALFHSIAGPRKRESSPSFFVQSPLWEDFDAFSAYVERLSEALTGGRHLCRILILYPLSGLFAAYQPDGKTQEFECIDSFLNALCIELMKRQLDYDLVDYPTLASAQVEDGHILLGDESYDMLLVPYTPFMRTDEYETVGSVAKKVETHFFYRSVEPVPANTPSQENNVKFVPTEDLVGFVMRLRHAIDDGVHLSGTGREDILLLQREKDGKRVCFIVNRSEHHRKITARFTGDVGLTVIELETGERLPLHSSHDGDKAEAVLHLTPYQSIVVEVGEPIEVESEHKSEARKIEPVSLRVETGENVASIFHFDRNGKRMDVRRDPVCIPANWAQPTFDPKELAGRYTAQFQVEGQVGDVRMVLDSDYAECDVSLNSSDVDLRTTEKWLLDRREVGTDVTRLLREGVNTVRIDSPIKLSEPIRLVGDFDVAESGKMVTIRPNGERDPFSLADAMPFYSGAVTCIAEFDLPEKPGQVELLLGDLQDSVTVIVNGESAGKRLWPPYTLDISKFVTPGRNEVRIEVRNSMSNLILGKTKHFGLKSTPKLGVVAPHD